MPSVTESAINSDEDDDQDSSEGTFICLIK